MLFYENGSLYEVRERNDKVARMILNLTMSLNFMFAEEIYKELPFVAPENFKACMNCKWDELSRWN